MTMDQVTAANVSCAKTSLAAIFKQRASWPQPEWVRIGSGAELPARCRPTPNHWTSSRRRALWLMLAAWPVVCPATERELSLRSALLASNDY
jgi:hypothetical protein